MYYLIFAVCCGLVLWLNARARERREEELAARLERMRDRLRGEGLEGMASAEVDAAIAAARAEAAYIRHTSGRGGY